MQTVNKVAESVTFVILLYLSHSVINAGQLNTTINTIVSICERKTKEIVCLNMSIPIQMFTLAFPLSDIYLPNSLNFLLSSLSTQNIKVFIKSFQSQSFA